MQGVFGVLFGLVIFEGLTAFPTSQDNDLKYSPFKKHSKSGRKMMVKKQKNNENPQFKSMDKHIDRSDDNSKDKSLENVISAIDTGVKTFIASENKSDILCNIAKSLVGLVKNNEKKSVFRSKAEEFVKSELIHFRNDPEDKPSVMLELNSKAIINGLKELLKSKLVHQLMQHYTKQAAVVYRSVRNELEKQQ